MSGCAVTYFKDAETAENASPVATAGICMGCGEPPAGPTVTYDMFMPDGATNRVLFHRDCAFAVAQRLICDAWPNRRDGEWMQNNR